MHSKIVGAFKQTYWPEGVTQDGDTAQYVDALAQLFSMRKIREAQARGVNVEEAVNNGNIEVVNDGKTVKVVLRHNARTETTADTQQTTDNTTAPTTENTEAREVSARERERQKIDIDEADVIAEFEQARRYHPPRKRIITVTGKELGEFDFSKTDKTERKAVIKQAVNVVKKLYNGFKGLLVTNPDVGNDIQILFCEHGQNEWTGRSAIPEKLMAMAKLPEIIRTAHAITGWDERRNKIDRETGEQKKAGRRKKKHDFYMTLQNEVNIAGKQYTVLVSLTKTGERVYFYNLRITALE